MMRQALDRFMMLAGMVLLIGLAGCDVEAETADLRGYGKVKAKVGPQTSEFVCENAAKADILLGKLLADLFWDAGAGHVEKTVKVNGKDVRVHVWEPYGALIAGRDGRRVLVVGGKDAQEALEFAQKNRRFLASSFQFQPSKPYPVYLDFFDLRAFKSYTSCELKSIKDRWPFVKQFGLGGLGGGECYYSRNNPAEGVVDWSTMDYETAAAERESGLYLINISTGQWPRWAWNKHPDYIGQVSSSSSLYWSVLPDQLNEGLDLTPEQRHQTSLRYLGDVIARYRNSPAVGGWQLYCGDYIFETYFSKLEQGLLDYSPTGQEGFRRWLRKTRHYSLRELGERWHGDPGRFKDWGEVRLPDDLNGFFGDLNDECFRIRDGWSWRVADTKEIDKAPEINAPGWVPVEMPPARYICLLPLKPAFYRVAFDPAEWLKKNVGKDVYLVCNINCSGWHEYSVWLNGKTLGKFKSKVDPYAGPFALKVTELLHSGSNTLVLQSPYYIHGPVFLTATKPVGYPYLGKNQNARYADMLEWQLGALNSKVAGAMEYARSIDPDRPIVLPAAGTEVKGVQGDVCSRFGASMQDTGYESSYRQFNSRLGYAGGFYGSCEPAGCHGLDTPAHYAAYTPVLTRMLSWMVINGEGSHMLFWDPAPYIEFEKHTGWFTKNRRLIQLVGKYLPEKPEIAILCSSESALLDYNTFHSMGDWDIGRGELHACHYDNVYVTTEMIARGLADDYPVLFDTDTMFMGQDTIDALRKYVEKGGTFVALHNSGRHSILEPDAWPISALTGFKVLALGKKGKIKFEKALPIFKGWEGKEFEGEGSALDWKDTQSAKDVSAGLEPLSKGTIALARWEDGTVAVGMRTLGKGKVIVLGSTFWRYGRDLGGTGIWKIQDMEKEFLERLFTDLGVKRTATASDKGVFARKVITKNGMQEWLIVMDAAGSGMKADAGFVTAEKPSEVWDMVEQKPVAFEYVDGWVKIKDINIEPVGTRIFGVKRAALSGGVDFWWKEKTKFWKSAKVKPFVEKEKQANANPPTIPFETWKFYADKDNSISQTDRWTQVSFDDTLWRDNNGRPWNLAYEDLKDYQGAGLYRSVPFSIPRSWEGRDIELFTAPAPWWITPDGFYLNGVKIPEARTQRKNLVTNLLKKDGNVLSVKVTTNPSLAQGGGLYFAIWLQPRRKLEPSISLLGDWQAVMGDWTSRQPVSLPGKVKGKYIVRDVDIPEEWRNRNVYVSFSPGLKDACIMLNGQPLLTQAGLDSEDINLTPYVKFGQRNRIEIWPQVSFWRGSTKGDEEGIVELKSIEIGCEAK